MQNLVVLSGKGGTGKTTIVGALATLWERLILVDCDVDASNLHLIIRPEIKEKHSFSGSKKARIDTTLCTGCNICFDYCRYDAIRYDQRLVTSADAGFRIDQSACEGCGLCSHVCPEKAIELSAVESGKWYLSDTRFGPLVHGRLSPAQGNSGRLVTVLRDKATEIAGNGEFYLTLMDGPPGIGCPTIATLAGVDYALIVTEPSQSAFHDLRRLAELIEFFKIPTGICINKSDINEAVSSDIEAYAAEHDITALGRLVYDKSVNQAQINNQTLVEFATDGVVKQVRSLHERLVQELIDIKDRDPIAFDKQQQGT
jgi:MinD superfamily P-loop ATPase